MSNVSIENLIIMLMVPQVQSIRADILMLIWFGMKKKASVHSVDLLKNMRKENNFKEGIS